MQKCFAIVITPELLQGEGDFFDLENFDSALLAGGKPNFDGIS